MNLLEVKNLSTYFFQEDSTVRAVDDVSYDLEEGETLALVGESGCGKSVSALSIMRLVPDPPGRIVNGEVIFNDIDLVRLSEQQMRTVRGREIAMIFQEPMTSLNPVLTIGRQLTEALELHLGMTSSEARNRAVELLDMVGIPEGRQRLKSYPHQFSGGMRQRVMIAMALSCNPKLLIADEPTTALDVTIQAQILELVQELCKELGTAVILITHNLGVVARYAHRVNVMYAGKIIERGLAREIYHEPSHPYTLGLLRSVPRLDVTRRERLEAIEGLPPELDLLPKGCAYYPRCPFRMDRCLEEVPPLEPVAGGHLAACWASETVYQLAKGAQQR
ncbi:MAG: ABC transporter ATP-binding protein [Chloroflexi bacterium]|nr:ABC transporter ATP-binding protein [Chloroflexota bacterium]